MGNAAPFAFADIANIFVMIMALVSFFIMIVSLLRNMAIVGVVGENDIMNRMHWSTSQNPPRLLMQRVHIPFTFTLVDPQLTSYEDVSFTVWSSVNYEMSCWWGAPVRELHAALWTSVNEVLHTNILDKHCASRDETISQGPHTEKKLRVGLHKTLELGPPPRACYPLVVILARKSQDIKLLAPDDTVALISIIHIQDKICPLPSGVLAQYLKQANGQLSCLKQLYVSGDCLGGEASCEGCCVCTAKPLSRALLPCRHACLCSGCLVKLDKCPICRSPIQSYFAISGEDDPPPAPSWNTAASADF